MFQRTEDLSDEMVTLADGGMKSIRLNVLSKKKEEG